MTHVTKTSLAFSLFVGILLASCQKQAQEREPEQVPATARLATGTQVTVNEIPFGPVTTNFVNTCSENIRFSGMIENRQHVTTTDAGNHYSRQFVAKGMTGVGVLTGDTYSVVGGSEMFSIKDAVFNANGTLNLTGSLSQSDVVIHQGTLVFESATQKIVARHIIRKVPGTDEIVNEWVCH
jgi:hypothetical protein